MLKVVSKGRWGSGLRTVSETRPDQTGESLAVFSEAALVEGHNCPQTTKQKSKRQLIR